jgi:hypothetical protein
VLGFYYLWDHGNVPAGDTGYPSQNCNSGDLATGGSLVVGPTPHATDYPNTNAAGDPIGWKAIINNTGGASAAFYSLHVVCADLTP